MAKYELLENASNGNYYPHGEFESENAAHEDAKKNGLKKYEVKQIKEHEQEHWGQ